MLLAEGQINRRIHFIESGMVHLYVSKPKEDITTWVLIENDFVVSPESFFRQTRALDNIQALEDTITRSISYGELQEIKRRHPEFGNHETAIDRHYRLVGERIRQELAGLSPEEKYGWFLKNYNHLAQRLPLPQMSTYLGMHIETLKIVRRGLNHK